MGLYVGGGLVCGSLFNVGVGCVGLCVGGGRVCGSLLVVG